MSHADLINHYESYKEYNLVPWPGFQAGKLYTSLYDSYLRFLTSLGLSSAPSATNTPVKIAPKKT